MIAFYFCVAASRLHVGLCFFVCVVAGTSVVCIFI